MKNAQYVAVPRPKSTVVGKTPIVAKMQASRSGEKAKSTECVMPRRRTLRLKMYAIRSKAHVCARRRKLRPIVLAEQVVDMIPRGFGRPQHRLRLRLYLPRSIRLNRQQRLRHLVPQAYHPLRIHRSNHLNHHLIPQAFLQLQIQRQVQATALPDRPPRAPVLSQHVRLGRTRSFVLPKELRRLWNPD